MVKYNTQYHMDILVVVVLFPSVNDDAKFPTKATYMQYRSLLLGQEDSHFTFPSRISVGSGVDAPDDFFVINV